MSSSPHTDKVFKDKKIPRNPIKFQIQLNEEQKVAKQTILDNTVTILKGKAGSGKSLLAAQVGLDLLFRNEVERIIITRPMVAPSDEMELGILPGGLSDKMALFTAPVYDNMFRLYSKEKIESFILEGKIQVLPMSMLRGRNFTDCLVIGDEMQNCTDRALEMLLTRICNGTKVILCGDSSQIDLRKKSDSGFSAICNWSKDITGFAVVNLLINHRHPIVDDILKMYSDIRS